MRNRKHFLSVAVIGISLVACGSGQECVEGDRESCSCAEGGKGERTCGADTATWGECSCNSPANVVLEGSYTIMNQLDVEELQRFERITGHLFVSAPGLSRLDLPGLQRVDGDVFIERCTTLRDLDGLSGLQAIGGGLEIGNNPELEQIDGLNGLRAIEGRVFIRNNAILRNLEGLSHVPSVGGFLYVFDNPSLESIEGLRGIVSIGESLYLWNNDSLTNFDGLRNLSFLGGGLCFSNDDRLQDVSGLSGITHVRGDLHVLLDHELRSLHGLHNIHTVDGTVFLGKWDDPAAGTIALETLDGLSGLRTVGGNLDISHNQSLYDVSGLLAISSLGGALFLINNAKLPSCAAQELRNRLVEGGWDGLATVKDNLADDCVP
jgi:hypothetical protein